MLKLMILAVKRAGMSKEDFRRHLSMIHGPLVMSVPDVVADIRHYHYNFPVSGSTDPLFGHAVANGVDVLTQIWFDDREAMIRNVSNSGYRTKVRPDEDNFADSIATVAHLTEERGAVGSRSARFKVFYCRRRRQGLTRAEFQEAWLRRFPAALAKMSAMQRYATGYVQNHCLPEEQHREGADEKYFDVIDELFTDDLELLRLSGTENWPAADVRSLESELLDTTRTLAFMSETQVTKP